MFSHLSRSETQVRDTVVNYFANQVVAVIVCDSAAQITWKDISHALNSNLVNMLTVRFPYSQVHGYIIMCPSTSMGTFYSEMQYRAVALELEKCSFCH